MITNVIREVHIRKKLIFFLIKNLYQQFNETEELEWLIYSELFSSLFVDLFNPFNRSNIDPVTRLRKLYNNFTRTFLIILQIFQTDKIQENYNQKNLTLTFTFSKQFQILKKNILFRIFIPHNKNPLRSKIKTRFKIIPLLQR